jgi:TPR repeat protein
MQELQRKLALNPEKVPEPPQDDARYWWPLALRLCAVAGVAALVAWGVVLLPGAHKAGNETAQGDITPSPSPLAVNRVRVVHIQPATAAPLLPHEEFAKESEPPQHAEVPAAAAGPTESQSAKSPSAISLQSTASAQSDGNTAVIDGDEIATLVKRGKDFVMNGDLASARLLLRRAAVAGSAEAALALGATFDPLIIARLGAVGAEPDVARARKWYQKAEAAGSQAASQQLAKLAQHQP